MRIESQSAEPQGHELPHLILLQREVRGHHEVFPASRGPHCLTTELIPGPLGLFLLLRKNPSEVQTALQVRVSCGDPECWEQRPAQGIENSSSPATSLPTTNCEC